MIRYSTNGTEITEIKVIMPDVVAHQMIPVVGGKSDPTPPVVIEAPHLGGIFL